ncbi:MAG: hypothetical protein AABX38_03485 [Candidatus Micrarchaeota archaeon]
MINHKKLLLGAAVLLSCSRTPLLRNQIRTENDFISIKPALEECAKTGVEINRGEKFHVLVDGKIAVILDRIKEDKMNITIPRRRIVRREIGPGKKWIGENIMLYGCPSQAENGESRIIAMNRENSAIILKVR